MNARKLVACASIVAAGLVIGSMAIAEPSKESKAAGQPEIKLPPGWSEEDMKACMIAGTPGKMHEHLTRGVGKWRGRTTMWMAPDVEPTAGECTSTVTALMDGRYVRIEMSGEMPGMGPYSGMGLYGFDNVSQKFVSSWIDNHSTGIGRGVGELSEDGKTLTWKFTFNCPLTKKPAVLREIETVTGPDSRKLETYGTDPKSGREFKMMIIELTRQ